MASEMDSEAKPVCFPLEGWQISYHRMITQYLVENECCDKFTLHEGVHLIVNLSDVGVPEDKVKVAGKIDFVACLVEGS